MSYIPTPEKMTALGFDNKFQLGPRVWLGSLVQAGYLKVVVPMYADGRVKVIVVDEDEEKRSMLFALPSEEFLHDLLVAVGFRFRAAHPATPAPTVSEEAGERHRPPWGWGGGCRGRAYLRRRLYL